MNTKKKTGHYINTPHVSIEELAIMAAQRVRNGEQANAVLVDMVDGYAFGYGSANYWFLKEAMEKEVKPVNITTAKHTPGPWEVDAHPTMLENELVEFATVTHKDGNGGTVYICDCWGLNDEKRNGQREASDTALANARLIAASPIMISALENVSACLCQNDPRVGKETKYARMRREYVLQTVKEAIAKAKGE